MANRLASPPSFKLELTPAVLVDHLEKEMNSALRTATKAGVDLSTRKWANPLRSFVLGSQTEPKPRLGGPRLKAVMPNRNAKFHADLAAAIAAVHAELGERWVFTPGAVVAADCKVYQTRRFVDQHGRTWSMKGPRDLKLPAARYWPDGELPPGIVLPSGIAPAPRSRERTQAENDQWSRSNRLAMLRYARSRPTADQRYIRFCVYREYFRSVIVSGRLQRKAQNKAAAEERKVNKKPA